MQRVDAARAFQMMHAAAYRLQIPSSAAALETRQHPFPDSMTRVFDDVTVGLQWSFLFSFLFSLSKYNNVLFLSFKFNLDLYLLIPICFVFVFLSFFNWFFLQLCPGHLIEFDFYI